VDRIEVFADVMCPFTYVGLRRLTDEISARDLAVAIRVRAWPLELINRAPLTPGHAAREIEALRGSVAPDLFGGFDAATFPNTSIPAFGLAAAAYAVDDATGLAVSLAVREALFERGADVSDPAVLNAIGCRFGVEPLGPQQAGSVARTDWERGKVRGVKGSPHFFVGDRSWFCPSLTISHDGDRFDVRVAAEKMRDFYVAALGVEEMA